MTENVVFHPLKKVIEFLGQNLTNKTLTLEWKKFDIRDKNWIFGPNLILNLLRKWKKSGSGFQYWFFFQAFSYLWHLSVHFTMPIQLSHVRCHEMVVVHLGLYSLSWSIWQLASVSFILCLKTKNSTNGTFSKNNSFY